MEWPSRLSKLRKSMKMSQRQFADLFSVAPGTISLWEKNQRQIPGPAQKLIEILEYNHQVKTDQKFLEFE